MSKLLYWLHILCLIMYCFTKLIPSSVALDCENEMDEKIRAQNCDSFKIKGGNKAAPESWAFIVVVTFGPIIMCGGTLIRQNWVLTAGHCIDHKLHKIARILDLQPSVGLAIKEIKFNYTRNLYEIPSDFKLPNLSIAVVDNVIPADLILFHPEYRVEINEYFQFAENDIALIQLQRSAILLKNIKLVTLPTTLTAIGDSCVVAGWGKVINDFITAGNKTIKKVTTSLKEAYLEIVENITCANIVSDVLRRHPVFRESSKLLSIRLNSIMRNKICAKYVYEADALQYGDSGGPLMCHGELHGVPSILKNTLINTTKYNYTMFGDVPAYTSWISETLVDYGDHPLEEEVRALSKAKINHLQYLYGSLVSLIILYKNINFNFRIII